MSATRRPSAALPRSLSWAATFLAGVVVAAAGSGFNTLRMVIGGTLLLAVRGLVNLHRALRRRVGTYTAYAALAVVVGVAVAAVNLSDCSGSCNRVDAVASGWLAGISAVIVLAALDINVGLLRTIYRRANQIRRGEQRANRTQTSTRGRRPGRARSSH